MQAEQSNIVRKLMGAIRKYGIKKYVNQFEKKVKKILETLTTNNFDEYLNTITKAYHNHSRVYFITNNTKDEYNESYKKPVCKFNEKTKIMTIKLFFFMSAISVKQIKNSQWGEYVAYVRKFVKQYADVSRGLIIDLREHTGGTMWINVEELQDVFGTTSLIAFSQTKAKTKDEWINIVKGKITKSKFITKNLAYTKPIAVLVGKNTVSTGEFMGAVFYGRSNTKLFGQPTSGYMSVNGMIKINKSYILNLTTGFATSVDGTFHDNELLDSVVIKTSKPISDAKQWINSLP